jgi:D-beta-D-heptose 7-phosphate kinase/D-beta-D-heptose 1-phosphate adenosyltransferase
MNKILVIGEICEDVFIYGKINRICPEAPVPIFNPSYEVKNPGMAGNVIRNLQSISDQIETSSIHQKQIITKTRIVDEKSNQMIVRVDDGEQNGVEPLLLISPSNMEKIETYDCVIISDYDKGFLPKKMIEKISYVSKLSILDSKKKLDFETIQNCTFVKLNETEYNNNRELVDNNLEKFIITLGQKGCMYNQVVYPSPNPKTTIDVSGAGDTFVASFAFKYLETNDIVTSINYANEMSSIVVSKKGVATP